MLDFHLRSCKTHGSKCYRERLVLDHILVICYQASTVALALTAFLEHKVQTGSMFLLPPTQTYPKCTYLKMSRFPWCGTYLIIKRTWIPFHNSLEEMPDWGRSFRILQPDSEAHYSVGSAEAWHPLLLPLSLCCSRAVNAISRQLFKQ